MNANQVHILIKSGVLASFSISKKISEKELNGLLKIAKKNGKSEEQIIEELKDKIMREIIDASKQGSIPGLLLEKVNGAKIEIQSIETLNSLIESIAKKFKKNNLDKMSLCYFINGLLKNLEMTEEDFEEFHRRIRNAQNEKSEEE